MTSRIWQCNKEGAFEDAAAAARELGFSFPGVHVHAYQMAAVGLEVRRRRRAPFCELPFCQTVEAESMGAAIDLGDGVIGPRPSKPCLSELEDILELAPADYSAGRARRVLQACALAREAGEPVALAVSGPFSIANALIDIGLLLKALRKTPVLAFDAMECLAEQSRAYVLAAKEYGVQAVRYADPITAPEILGPKLAERVARRLTLPHLERLRTIIGPDACLLVCPKTGACLPPSTDWQLACRWQKL